MQELHPFSVRNSFSLLPSSLAPQVTARLSSSSVLNRFCEKYLHLYTAWGHLGARKLFSNMNPDWDPGLEVTTQLGLRSEEFDEATAR